MKGLRIGGAAVLAALLLPIGALGAPPGTYPLEELRMELTVPEGLTVLLRETAAEDPDIGELDLDGAALAEQMEKQGVYLTALPREGEWELSVGMTEEEGTELLFDFNLYDEALLLDMAQELTVTGGYQAQGYTFEDISVFQGDQARFLVIDSAQDQGERTLRRRQYYTVYNGQAINLVLVAYDGELAQERTGALESLVESVTFTESLPIPQESRRAAARAKRERGGSNIGTQAISAGLGAGLLTYFMTRKKRGPAEPEAQGGEQDEHSQ